MVDKQLFLLPQPPRSSGDAQKDLSLIIDWQYRLYRAVTSYVQAQTTSGNFNPANLPDPASTNLATAQSTANQAYALATTANTHANTAQTTATTAGTNATTAQSAATAAQATATTANNRTVGWFAGQVTVSGAATSQTHTFSGGESEADTAYHVLVTPVSAVGTPDPNSNHVLTVSKTTAHFVVNVEAAPGVGNSVTFDFLVVRFP